MFLDFMRKQDGWSREGYIEFAGKAYRFLFQVNGSQLRLALSEDCPEFVGQLMSVSKDSFIRRTGNLLVFSNEGNTQAKLWDVITQYMCGDTAILQFELDPDNPSTVIAVRLIPSFDITKQRLKSVMEWLPKRAVFLKDSGKFVVEGSMQFQELVSVRKMMDEYGILEYTEVVESGKVTLRNVAKASRAVMIGAATPFTDRVKQGVYY